MKKIGLILSTLFIIGLIGLNPFQKKVYKIDNPKILSYIIDPKTEQLEFFWKSKNEVNYKNFKNLKSTLEQENKKLVFAMNDGMFNKDFSPQGLYIENGKVLGNTDTIQKGYGNFYLQPNGIFYLTNNNKPIICKTLDFKFNDNIKYATQSGPLLLFDGKVDAKFNESSKNIHIRNGVGILPDGKLLFAISKEKINFYDFAIFFKQNGCMNALYLDGFVSRVYLPAENWEQLDGNFAVIIGEVKESK